MKRRHKAHLVGAVILGAALALAMGTAAWAYWVSSAVGSGAASTGNLAAPTDVVASAPMNSSTVAVTWAGSTLLSGQPATGYYVVRIRDADGAIFPGCGTSLASLTTTLSCSDLGVTHGTYHYRVTAVFGSWTAGRASLHPVTVVDDSSLPTVAVVSVSPAPNVNGYGKTSPVVVNLSASPASGGSSGSAIASITYSINSGASVTSSGATAAASVTGNGIHTLTYSAKDASGRTSVTSSLLVRIDTVAPAAPSRPVMTAESDSGSSSTDGITKVMAPTFTGTAENGSTVTIYDGTTAIGTGQATSGAYRITSSALPESTKTITAKATDIADNAGPISSGTIVTIDVTAPAAPGAPVLTAASDTGRSTTDKITKLPTPTFSGSTTAGTPIFLFDGSVAVGSITATSTAYSVTSSALTNGTHTITAKAADVAGNLSVSTASSSVTVDTVLPVAPTAPVLSAASDTGISNSDGITKTTTLPVTGTNEPQAIVILYDGTTSVGSRLTTNGSYSLTSSALANGTHQLKTTATDVAGNEGPASGVKTVLIDTVAPVAPSTPVLTAASDTGISSSDRITKTTALVLTGTSEAGTNVALRDSGAATGTSVTATGGHYSATTGILAAGARTMTAIATDLAGNVGPTSTATTITIDTTDPSTTVNKASRQADPTTAASITFTAVFSEAVYTLTGPKVSVSGTAGATTIALTGSGTTYSIAVSGMTTTGTVITSIGAGASQDAAGNLNTASTSTDNSVAYTDAAAPMVAITSFTAGSSRSAMVSGTASISPGDGASVRVVICSQNAFPCSAGNTVTTLTQSVNATTGAWSVTSGPLAPYAALYSQATQTDLAGNIGNSAVAGPTPIV